jgi:hypothetical protein
MPDHHYCLLRHRLAGNVSERQIHLGWNRVIAGFRFNNHALDQEKFRRRIMVYGEDHTNPNLPSIPGERGVVMFEAKNPERCIQNYTALESNRCISIDRPDLSAEYRAIDRVEPAYWQVLDEISPNGVRDIKAQLRESATFQEFMMKAHAYLRANTKAIFESGDEAREKRFMEKLRAISAVNDEAWAMISSGRDVRDDHMFEQALSNIQGLSGRTRPQPSLSATSTQTSFLIGSPMHSLSVRSSNAR